MVRHAIGDVEDGLQVRALKLGDKLRPVRGLLERVVDQARCRVLGGSMYSSEEVLSVFESHTDLMVKEDREVEIGY